MVPNLSAGITPGPETGDRSYLEAILRYNEDDCRATYHIKDWLVQFAEPYWNRLYQAI